MNKNIDIIPFGVRCFSVTSKRSDDGGKVYRHKLCPYWMKLSSGKVYCEYMSRSDIQGILSDQTKICGVNVVDE